MAKAKRKSLQERLQNVLTSSDINFLKRNAEKYTLMQLSAKLGKSNSLVQRNLKTLGLQALDKVETGVEIEVEEETPENES